MTRQPLHARLWRAVEAALDAVGVPTDTVARDQRAVTPGERPSPECSTGLMQAHAGCDGCTCSCHAVTQSPETFTPVTPKEQP